MSRRVAIAFDKFRDQLTISDHRGPKPGLIIGKGPSFDRLTKDNFDLSTYLTVGLNHVVRNVPIDILSAIDLDVIEICSEEIYKNAKILAVQYYPHIDSKPSEKCIFDFFDSFPVLKTFYDQNRLLIFNGFPRKNRPKLQGAPNCVAKFFSSEAAYDLLVLLGVKQIHTVGIDGGKKYSRNFSKLTSLTNNRSSFGDQFLSLNRKFQKTGIPFGPVGATLPIRIFVGCDETQYLASRVLEYSLYVNCDAAVDFKRIDNSGLPVPTNPGKRARTPFSFSRFKIPELCGFRGRAIYLDADMLVFANIRELWEQDFEDYSLLYSCFGKGRNPQFSVMLLNCEELSWLPSDIVGKLENKDISYDDIMFRFNFMDKEKIGPILPEEWNSLEYYQHEETKLLHYTDMDRQPWVTDINENANIFYEHLRSAMETHGVSRREFASEIRDGNVSPRLPDWAGLKRPRGLPDNDDTWIPPYRRLIRERRPLRKRLLAKARRLLQLPAKD